MRERNGFIKYWLLIGLIGLMVLAVSGCLMSPEQKEALDAINGTLNELSDDRPLPDTSDCYVKFTVSGHSGGTYRLEGEEANDCVGMIPQGGSMRLLSFDLYDETSRTDLMVNSRVDLAALYEQTCPTSPITAGMVTFNTEDGQWSGGNWQDHFHSLNYPQFYGNPDDLSSADMHWNIRTEKLAHSRIRIMGNVTFQAANSPYNEGAKNFDKNLVEAVMLEMFEKGNLRPLSTAVEAGGDYITVRGDFDIIIVDTGILYEL